MRKYVKTFEVFTNDDTSNTGYTTLIHTTTPSIATIIKDIGFEPVKFLDYKYYSDFGENGIYFYDNLRWVQSYAYFLQNKTKVDKVALIYCKAPNDIIKRNSKMEDGIFISKEDLKKVIVTNIQYKKAVDIY